MKYGLYLLLCLCFAQHAAAQQESTSLETGDLIFQDLDCGDMCDAIEAVTKGFNGLSFSHVGLVDKADGRVLVIEAIGSSVRRIPLDSFARRTGNKMYVGRVRKPYRHLVSKALQYARKQLGTPYDDAFLYDNGKYYCSELIYDAFLHANHNKPFFALEPMTFKKPGSDEYFPVWKNYYEQLGIPVPEGQPGCNPGGLSRSAKLLPLQPLDGR